MPSAGTQDGPKQPMISSFFTKAKESQPTATRKRQSSPIDLTSDAEEQPPTKKTRVENAAVPPKETPTPPVVNGSLTDSSKPKTRKQIGKAIVQKWRFKPSQVQAASATSGTALTGTDAAEYRKAQERREILRKKLLGPNNPLTRRSEVEDVTLEQGESPLGDDEETAAPEDSDEGTPTAAMELRHKFAVKGKAPNGEGKGKTKGRGKKAVEIGPSGLSFTPLENQIRDLKMAYPDTLLLVEVGYKYRFFGEDATIASKELGIAAFPNRNFMSASIPVHRRPVHVKKLVSRGYKVGVVGQTETAALKKVGDNRGGPFVRRLQALYTPATYVDEADSLDDDDAFGQTTTRPLMCLIEELRGGMGADEKVMIGMVSVVPSTGDIIYDEFQDGHMRSELETRLTHLNPCELILPSNGLSKTTERLLSHFAGNSTAGEGVRIERIAKVMDYSSALEVTSTFYSKKAEEHPNASESFRTGKLMATVVDLPHKTIIALAHCINHLTAFGLADSFLRTKFFAAFTTKAHMLLAGNTLSNLELFRNQDDFTERGSLMWILDHTKTKFGSRLLRSWVGRPLVDIESLNARIDAVEEILYTSSPIIEQLRTVLKGTPDLVKGLCRVQYGKCPPKELASLLSAFNRIARAFPPFETRADVGFKSSVLNDVVYSLPTMLDAVTQLMQPIDLRKARDNNKDELWLDPQKYPAIQDTKDCIATVEYELGEHLHEIRKTIKQPSAKYVTVSGIEYMIEVSGIQAKKLVPADWSRVSATRSVTRFHTPEVRRMLEERERHKEGLAAEAEKAYQSFLQEVAENYDLFREATNKLALADCLLSLATVGKQQGYCRPAFVEDDRIEIVNGRHPMVEALISDPFVPNTVTLGGDVPRSRVVTGPNMGGKSSCVRMAALIVIMAQIGSYVPADAVTLGVQEAVMTRMGASDDLIKGRSTFMVELSETSDILKTASPRSLIILDELGRGTSTFDGMAIASAVLTYLVQDINAKTLFITHYPLLAAELEKQFPTEIANNHMGFIEEEKLDGTTEINFLYKLTAGMARGSYGIECARLAGMPESVLDSAMTRSGEMRKLVEQRTEISKLRKELHLIERCLKTGSDDASLKVLMAMVN
ncbi:DNA mismatch repair protein MSH3 [Calocera viscosa TUFC12733]|uniref:DNA mismatch repair protein MSH3 n=1 Tax=Calocera viscosa (strain TUFC12733) TaxID=1330018 RepID=A0A167LI81_CALVF|nr:DNA mismatch repair protein MSH3 [Calocera viscosa TUFC12733]